MSLDIYLGMNLDYGGPDGPQWHEAFSANFTNNVIPMWKLAGVYEALYESANSTAADIAPALERGVEFMSTQAAECRKLDAPNGWGTYADALPWLKGLAAACRRYPKATVRVWL